MRAISILEGAYSRLASTIRDSVLPSVLPILVFGLLIRAVLWIYSSQADLSTFAGISQSAAYGYRPYVDLNIYPPGWNLILALIGRLVSVGIPPGNFLAGTSLASSLAYTGLEPTAIVVPAYAVVEKAFLSVFDVISGLTIVAIAKDLRVQRIAPRTIFALWFLNPLVITVSAVHGNYDVVSTTFVLLAVYLCIRRDWLYSGIALSLGAILSLYPVFLAPILLALACTVDKDSVRTLWKRVAMLAGGLSVPLALVLWPPQLLSKFYTGIFTGPSVGLNPGGFWIWSTVSLPGFGGWRQYVLDNSAVVVLVCAVVTVSCIFALACHVLIRRPGVSSSSILAYFGLAVIVSYTVLPITQPQNIVWVLPYATLLAVENRSLIIFVLAITAFPLAFYWIGLGGPLYLMQGLAVYTHLVKASTVVASVSSYVTYHSVTFPLTQVPAFVALCFIADAFAWKIAGRRSNEE